jgi:hypothetical protein
MLNLSVLFIKARTTLAYNTDDNPFSKLSGTVPIFNIISFDLNIKHAGAMPLHDAIQSERQFIPKKISLMRFHTSIEESVIHSLHFNSLRLVEVVPLAGNEQALLAESDFG